MHRSDPSVRDPAPPWMVLVWAMLILGFFRGVRSPGLWAYSHALFDYESGFVKRGLFGAVTGWVTGGEPISYASFAAGSLVLLGINLLLLGGLLGRLVRTREPILIAAALVTASSLGVVGMAHFVGYADHLGLLVVMLLLRVPGFIPRLIAASALLPLAILVHEATLIMIFPVLFMSLLLEPERSPAWPGRLVLLTVLSALALGLTAGVSRATLPSHDAATMAERAERVTGVDLRDDAFDVLHRDGRENLVHMSGLWAHPDRAARLAMSLAVTAPAFGWLGWITAARLRRSGHGAIVSMLAVLAGVAPLTLHAVGWDMHRWNAMAIITSVLMLASVVDATRRDADAPDPRPLSRTTIIGLALLIHWQGISAIPLFDGHVVRDAPFLELQEHAREILRGDETFLAVPEAPP